MNIFCFLWTPLFYLFWRSVTKVNPAGGAWAFLLGTVTALVQFFAGPLIEPEGFGFSRWLSGCVDIVALPVVAPLLIYFLLFNFKIIAGTPDFANFTFQWLIPGAIVRALSWTFLRDPIHLVLVPVLWTAIAAGIPFFINLMLQFGKLFVIIPSALAILVIPLAAASSYWAFFSHDSAQGWLFLSIAIVPMLVSGILSFVQSEEEN